uniref:Uncharacterized protein n=1 Tax=Romanomermis culicivorax TaxID=13658 RepID=A0A915IEL6_ROMCU
MFETEGALIIITPSSSTINKSHNEMTTLIGATTLPLRLLLASNVKVQAAPSAFVIRIDQQEKQIWMVEYECIVLNELGDGNSPGLGLETSPLTCFCRPILRIGRLVGIGGDSERRVVDFAAY